MDRDNEQEVAREIELETGRRERDIQLTVHVWYVDHGIKYNRPTIIKLKVDENLFYHLNRLLTCESWGSVCMKRDWYIRSKAPNSEFNKHETEECVNRLELSVRTWPNPRNIPTIMLQDIRHIEKMPPSYDAMAAPRAHLLAMSECLWRL